MSPSKTYFPNSIFVSLKEEEHLKNRAPPVARDGQYDHASGENEQYSLANDIQNISQLAQNLKSPAAILDKIRHPDAIDDRKDLFVESLAALTMMDPGPIEIKLNNEAITLLYDTLSHPPATFLGYGTRFRAADGGGNNPEWPDLGRAGQPYARSVQGKHPQSWNSLPDPNLIFDELLKAKDFNQHPGGNSSLTFAFASLVTHSLFRTDPQREWINNTSSYLDLSPLYGASQAEQDSVRDKGKGRGLLYNDCFAEERLGFLPPAASALLIIFCRNHNYIAQTILSINEKGKWKNPPPIDDASLEKQDEEIFQTARLINCGHFMAMIFGDYVAGFLGLGRYGSSWSMDPFDPIKRDNQTPVSRGQGNAVSVEFNLLYRWHAVTAYEDITWTEDAFKYFFKGKPADTLTVDEIGDAFRDAFAKESPSPANRTFGGLKRGPDGKFSDDDLATILHGATGKMAGAYRARGTPAVLKVVEVMAIQQAREWGVCTMNEFRAFLGLKQFESFEEWNKQVPGVAEAARKLYGHIDNLELYVGLQAEDCMTLGRGSGICCGYTMTRAILADAIALVRGDRYYTNDYTPANLTSWGYLDCIRDPNNGAYGAALPKLLMRHLPRHYPDNSLYSLFPFYTPETMEPILSERGVMSKYDAEKPAVVPEAKVVETIKGIEFVFGAQNERFKRFNQIREYEDSKDNEKDKERLGDGYEFVLNFDYAAKHKKDWELVIGALFPHETGSLERYKEWYVTKVRSLLEGNSYTYSGRPGKTVDVVREVINLASVHWSADILCGIPLKTKANPHGVFTEQEAYDMFVELFTCIFENVQPEHGWALRSKAADVFDRLCPLVEQSIAEVSPYSATNALGLFQGVFAALKDKLTGGSKECHPFLSNLVASGRPMRELVECVIGLAVGSSVNVGQALAQVVDLYLQPRYAADCEMLKEACRAGNMERVKGYVREGMRLAPQCAGLLRTVLGIPGEQTVIEQGSGKEKVIVKTGDLVFASFKNAGMNPVDFPNPEVIDPTRPRSSYGNQGSGFHLSPSADFTEETFAEILKYLFLLPGFRRADGKAGQLAGFDVEQFGTKTRMYVDGSGNWSTRPGSLFVDYDA